MDGIIAGTSSQPPMDSCSNLKAFVFGCGILMGSFRTILDRFRTKPSKFEECPKLRGDRNLFPSLVLDSPNVKDDSTRVGATSKALKVLGDFRLFVQKHGR